MPPERRWARLPRDAFPAVFGLALSPVVAATAPTLERPLERMQRLIELERRVGLFFEADLYAWCAARPRLLAGLQVSYVAAHLPVALGVLVWAWYARPEGFPLAVVGYVLFPTAPPRMVPGLGYDTRPGPGDVGLGRRVQSPYAAMPSAHTAFAVVAAGTVWALTETPAVRAAALAFPPFVIGEILATGNHIWLDALGGVVVAGLGFAAARALRRRRGR
jgi:hypothetical protein